MTEHPVYPFRFIGDNVTIRPGARIVGAGNIAIGSNVLIDDFVLIEAEAPVYIGNYVHLGPFVSITGGGVCYIEDFVTLAAGVRVLTGPRSLPADLEPAQPGACAAVELQAHAFVGANSVVAAGTSLGAGAVVGSQCEARGRLESWTVYGGRPLRRLRARPSEQVRCHERELFERCGTPSPLFQGLRRPAGPFRADPLTQ